MKLFTILRFLAFVANMVGAYFLVYNWITFLVFTGVIVLNYLEGIAKGEKI